MGESAKMVFQLIFSVQKKVTRKREAVREAEEAKLKLNSHQYQHQHQPQTRRTYEPTREERRERALFLPFSSRRLTGNAMQMATPNRRLLFFSG